MIRAYILNQELADKQLDQMQLSSRPHKLQSTVPESFITAFGGSPSNPQLCWGLLAHLKQYKARNGDCRVPKEYKEADGYNLGLWVGTQRSRKSKLSSERRRRLDELGFVWNPFEGDWENGFGRLKQYKARVGNCLVPQGYKEADGYNLGNWARTQRASKSKLSSERRGRLDELGFVWKVR